MKSSGLYKFPTDRAVFIAHADFVENRKKGGMLGIVAPSRDSGVHHVGILEIHGSDWKFIKGPASIKSNRIWRWFMLHDERWPRFNCYPREVSCVWSEPAATLDDFTDAIAGRLVTPDSLSAAALKVDLIPWNFARNMLGIVVGVIRITWISSRTPDGFRILYKIGRDGMKARQQARAVGKGVSQ